MEENTRRHFRQQQEGFEKTIHLSQEEKIASPLQIAELTEAAPFIRVSMTHTSIKTVACQHLIYECVLESQRRDGQVFVYGQKVNKF